MRREIERVLGASERARDVALALSVGSDAIDLGRVDVALEALEWAKHVAPRVPAVREAYGVVRYLDEDYSGALTELQAYRRMTGRVDQNHLIADCLRGLGRDRERVVALVEELLEDEGAPSDRRAEAVIVWAGALVDEGHLDAARSLLRRHLSPAGGRDGAIGEPHQLRVLVMAAELAEQAGDAGEARTYRALIARSAPELLEDVAPADDERPDAGPGEEPDGRS